MRQGSYRNAERTRALVGLAKMGLPDQLAGLLLRDAATLARLAEAQCNGDWPADNGEIKREHVEASTCANCGGLWRNLRFRNPRVCDDCRAEARIRERMKPFAPQGIGVDFAGDPRGYVVVVWQAGGQEVGLA